LHRIRSSLALMAAAIIWGLAFVAQRVSVDLVGAFTFNGLRFAIGALSLIPLTFFFKPASAQDPGWRAALLPGLGAGVILFAAASLQQIGLKWTTAGKAAFLTGFYILLVPIIGLWFRRRPNAGVWLGALLGLAGLYLLSVTEAFTIGLGDSLQLVGAVFWTFHILVIDRWGPRVDPLKLSVTQFVVCAVLSLAIGLPFEPLSAEGLQECLPALLYAGFGSVGIAYTLQVLGQRGVAPGPAALILSLETVFAAFGGWLLLGETLGPRELGGCALMLIGMVLAQLWPAKNLSR
jgi:drug/metabolite transporter (DMT)-like permease